MGVRTWRLARLGVLVVAPVMPALALLGAGLAGGQALALGLFGAMLVASVVVLRLEALGRRVVRRERGRAQRRLQVLSARTAEVIAVVDGQRNVVELSPSVEWLWGYAPSVLLGKAADLLVHSEDAARFRGYLNGIGSGDDGRVLPVRVRHADGSWRQVEVAAADARDEARVEGIVVTYRTQPEGTQGERQLVHHAFHDPLTGLPNRALFADRVEHALARSERSESTVGVLVLDLDDFRIANEGLGHAAGDELLVAVGKRICTCLREGDTAARLGGDEFALLLESVSDAFGVSAAAERLREVLQLPLTVGDEAVAVSASIGMAMAESDTTSQRLVAQARSAMELAKANGKGRAELFLAVRSDRGLSQLELMKADLTRALPTDAVFLLYQPIVDLRSGRVVGAEALPRWQHPEHGLLDPSDFLSVADEAGLAIPLGRRMLTEACSAARRWRLTHPEAGNAYVGVNISAAQLRDPRFPADVRRALERASLEPDALVLELRESVVMAEADGLADLVGRLRRIGVRLAVDGFGTGSGAPSYLQHLRIDIAKIDSTFIGELGRGTARPTTMRGLIALTRTLDLTPLAEGVEEEWQRAELLNLGCVYGQGELFCKPVDAERITALLAGSA